MHIPTAEMSMSIRFIQPGSFMNACSDLTNPYTYSANIPSETSSFVTDQINPKTAVTLCPVGSQLLTGLFKL